MKEARKAPCGASSQHSAAAHRAIYPPASLQNSTVHKRESLGREGVPCQRRRARRRRVASCAPSQKMGRSRLTCDDNTPQRRGPCSRSPPPREACAASSRVRMCACLVRHRCVSQPRTCTKERRSTQEQDAFASNKGMGTTRRPPHQTCSQGQCRRFRLKRDAVEGHPSHPPAQAPRAAEGDATTKNNRTFSASLDP